MRAFLVLALFHLTSVSCITHILTALFKSIIEGAVKSDAQQAVISQLMAKYYDYRATMETKKPINGKLMPLMEAIKAYEMGRFGNERRRVSSRPAYDVIVQCLVNEEDELKAIPKAFNVKEQRHEDLSLFDRVLKDFKHELMKVACFYNEQFGTQAQSPKAHAMFSLIEYFGLDGYPNDEYFVRELSFLLPEVTNTFISAKKNALKVESDALKVHRSNQVRNEVVAHPDRIIHKSPHTLDKWTVEDFDTLEEGATWKEIIEARHQTAQSKTIKTHGRFRKIKYSEAANQMDSFPTMFKYTSVPMITVFAALFQNGIFQKAPHNVKFTITHLAHHLHTFTHDLLAKYAAAWSNCYELTETNCRPVASDQHKILLAAVYWKEMVIVKQIQNGSRPALRSISGRMAVSMMSASVYYAIRTFILRYSAVSAFNYPDFEARDHGTLIAFVDVFVVSNMFERNMAELHVIKYLNGRDSQVFKTMMNSYVHQFNLCRIAGKISKPVERGTHILCSSWFSCRIIRYSAIFILRTEKHL